MYYFQTVELSSRMILYYKYGPNARDCVKVIRSGSPNGRIGLRFLQVNMFHEDFSRNTVEIFDGRDFDQQSLVVEIKVHVSLEVLYILFQELYK